MRFESWYFLILILPCLFFLKKWYRNSLPADIRVNFKLTSSKGKLNPIHLLFILKWISLLLVIFALARPQSSFQKTERKVSGLDILLVMDVSASMNIEDMGNKSRLDLAKETIENFIKGRQNDRIGFVVFSGEPLTLAPPTLDYGVVLKSVREAETGVLKDGTGIGDGLSLAVNRLRQTTAKSRVIVLLTDGDNNVGQVDPATAGDLAAGYGMKVYTIAIGKEGRVRIPIKRKGILGNTVVTYQWMDNALNPELLQKIAEQTEGRFYRVEDEETLVSVFQEIDQLEKTEIKTQSKIRYDETFQKPLKIALLLLVIESLLSFGWWRIFI